MQKFEIIESNAIALPLINIDTDMIIPKQFLKTIKRTGLGKSLFHEMRYDLNENEITDFIFNKKEFKNSKILIALDNFGCGSSREHAPWSLLDFGIRCIIAPSFADIFYNNCFKNSILPIILDNNIVKELIEIANNPNNIFTVNLDLNLLSVNNKSYHFKIDDFKKHCLLNGLDDIGLTLEYINQIKNYEASQTKLKPWLFENLKIKNL
jgi:3-isopropylmalate/(R)-2-methylmalate dehydratase small subunit